MSSRSRSRVLAALALAAALPAPALAQEAVVGGHGPRVRFHHRPPVMTGAQPVFVVIDGLAAFGDLDVAAAPPLEIRVEGDVDVIQLPDGSLRFELGGRDDADAEE